jgi:hypothetical protein
MRMQGRVKFEAEVTSPWFVQLFRIYVAVDDIHGISALAKHGSTRDTDDLFFVVWLGRIAS